MYGRRRLPVLHSLGQPERTDRQFQKWNSLFDRDLPWAGMEPHSPVSLRCYPCAFCGCV